MNLIRSVLALTCFSILTQAPLSFADGMSKRDYISEILKMQGGGDGASEANTTARQADPHFNELADSLIDVYDKRFSSEEVKQLFEFFKQPVAVKFMKAGADIKKESVEAVKAWGEKYNKPVDDLLK